ncbi:MAG: lamin tail domain-containing protein [Caldilineaceae bacterium]|nr:lamin tail domain-containing protein [Caldilineaceae bacterium]
MGRILSVLGLLAMLSLAWVIGVERLGAASPHALRISQIYGAGGNSGALWQADFIELFNAGDVEVPLTGWAVEYAPADSASWRRTPLDPLIIAPFGYILIGQVAGNSGDGLPLPMPDSMGATNLNASDGKVRLVDSAGTVIDLVGYGTANEYEGTGPTGKLSATKGALRGEEGCLDTDQNAADFLIASPNPRNSASPAYPCALEPTPTESTPTTTPEITPSATVTITETLTPSPTAELPTETPTLPATSTPAAGIVLISEFLANPAAVDDNLGEWIEIGNPSAERINLRGWTLADLGQDRHTIGADLWVEAGGYVVLARNGDSTQNGGVIANYVYSSIALANSDDELLLLNPNGDTVDQVAWGAGTGLSIKDGASLYRAELTPTAAWLTSTLPWPGSAGDLGSPGASDSSTIPTPTSVIPTGEPTMTPTVTPTPGPSQPVYISEFMADPAAVNDSNGEWIEIHNPGPADVNLRSWTLADDGGDRHVIASDLWLAAGGYAALARNGDPTVNGGVIAAYVYRSTTLANTDDAIRLLDPNGVEMDRVNWGQSTALRVIAGASLERTVFGAVGQWQTAAYPWPGSAGDSGSPGAAYGTSAPASPTPTVTGTLIPTAPPTPTPEPSRPAIAWRPVETPSPLQIEEVHFRGSGVEFVALINVGEQPLDLTGWRVGDAEIPGDGEGIYALPDGVLLAPNAIFVIGRNGVEFQARWGVWSDAQFEKTDAPIPDLARVRELATGTFALNDSGDEVVLLDPADRLADVVVFGNGDSVSLGVFGLLRPSGDASLQRIPGFVFPTTRDLRLRFLLATPDPLGVQWLPSAASVPPIPLPDGYLGLVGSLGAGSNLSPGGIAPPHLLAWAAAASGLHFIVLADPTDPAQREPTSAPILSPPAWRWLAGEEREAIVYGPFFGSGPDTTALLDGLTGNNAIAQWIGREPPEHPAIAILPGDSVKGPADLFALWRQRKGNPPLIAGNALPPLPGYFDPQPRYTGLAVQSADLYGIDIALRARRGWLTTDPGLALTLRSEGGAWMGGVIPIAAELSLIVNYQDSGGEVAGLSIWQDNRPIRQLDLLPVDGEWRVSIPALPGSLIYAVATQADGDFAVTMPLRVPENESARIWINEVMPIPLSDFNGDGVADTDDEYIELWNAGPVAISLAGWVLEDRPADEPTVRRRFTLGPQHFLDVGRYLLIWSRESFIGLNNRNERLDLFDAAGNLVDTLSWTDSPGGDRTLSRIPDGGRWDIWGPSPGRSNGDYALIIPPTATPPAWAVAGSAAPGTPGGEAVGPFGSVTASKLAGLGERVRFVGVVTAPPGLFNSAIYVADPAADGETAALGIQIYLRRGSFPALAEGDRVEVQGAMHSNRGEREILIDRPEDLWRVGPGEALSPLSVSVADIAEPLEGRLVTFEGIVSGYRGNSIFLADPDNAEAEPVEVHVRSSLSWRRPFVNEGERWRVVGIVGQFAQQAPWNGGYWVLVRYEGDLVRLSRAN